MYVARVYKFSLVLVCLLETAMKLTKKSNFARLSHTMSVVGESLPFQICALFLVLFALLLLF